MLIYILNLVFVFCMSYMARMNYKSEKKIGIPKKPNLLFVTLLLIPMILIGGLRYQVGTDFLNYTLMYNSYSNQSISEILLGEDLGFGLINWICSKIVYNPQLMFFVCVFLTTLIIVTTIRKYSNIFEISMFLYISTMAYYSQFNIVRQCLASAIIFWGIKYIFNDNKLKYFAIVIFASMFHSTAIVMIPVYYLVKIEPWSKKMLLIILGAISIMVLFDPFLNVLNIVLQGTKYQVYTIIKDVDNGVNFIRVIVLAIPIILSYFYKNKLNDNEVKIYINYSIFYFMIMLISVKATYFARIAGYFNLYNILLFPKIILAEKSKLKYLIYVSILICYTIYMILLLPVESNLLPYQTIFK